MNSLISVTALNSSGSLESFSNYGHKSVGVGAPGVSIISTIPGNGYGHLSGTSMATPHVTGISILLASYEPELSAAQIKQRIISAAEPVLTLASRSVSAGNANAHNAILNRTAVPQGPAINRVQSSKKVLTIDGLGFVNGSTVIEINGVAVTDAEYVYDSSYALASGTVTRLELKLGKSRMKEVFPSGQSVEVDVYNPTTGQRSASVTYVRF
jgi:subtilisin family serine protease